MPNQTMKTGMSPNSGSVRSICSSGSMAFSPIRLRPAVTARISAAAAPNAKPSATRCSEIAIPPCSVPKAGEFVVTSETAVDHTVLGGGSFCALTTPVLLMSCQISSTSSGLISRSQPRRARLDPMAGGGLAAGRAAGATLTATARGRSPAATACSVAGTLKPPGTRVTSN